MTKNNRGGLKSAKNRADESPPELLGAEDPKKCLVTLLQKARDARPDNFESDAVFLRPKKKYENGIGFCREVIGEHTLTRFMKDLVERVDLPEPGRFSNHSMKATAITQLMEAGVDDTAISHQVGNSSLQSMKRYRRSTASTTEKISKVFQKSVNNENISTIVAGDANLSSSRVANNGSSSLSGGTLQLFSNLQSTNFSNCNFSINLCDKTENKQYLAEEMDFPQDCVLLSVTHTKEFL